MSIFFTSDHHFGQATARSFYHRPFISIAEMDRELINRWNFTVGAGDEDEVWHLGDFTTRQSPERVLRLLQALHGRKHLVFGNNDDDAVTSCPGWQSVQPYAELAIGDQKLVLCHYPFRTWRNMHKGWINLHGHSHGRLKPLPRQFDVGVDVRGFRPVEIGDLLNRAVEKASRGRPA
jgi:calcineurin-like phosphoesterase family protein